jgi:hypothetical protein
MPRRAAIRLAAALFLLLGGSVVTADAQVEPPPTGFEVGRPFPVASFPSLDGSGPMSVADLRGHKVILHVFASW